MKRMTNCCTLASVSVLLMLGLFPEVGWSDQDFTDIQSESGRHGCVVQDIAPRKFEDIAYDSFVSLMGKRSTPKMTRILDRLLEGLFGRTKKVQ